MGFYDNDKPVIYSDIPVNSKIIKTHNISYKYWSQEYANHNLFFVCSERKELQKYIPNETKLKNNVLVVEYSDLIKDTIILDLKNKLISLIPETPNVEAAISRIENMNKLCSEIKNYPFSYCDKFYHIHGSHRSNGSQKTKNTKRLFL
jgi:hypothetical protein